MNKRIGYLGGPATFGHMAAKKYFGDEDVEYVSFSPQDRVCEAVSKAEVDFGVVAIENSIDGPIAETVRGVERAADWFGIRVRAEVVIKIEHFCLRKPGAQENFAAIVSHESALRQCRRFVRYWEDQGVLIRRVTSTGEAAEMASNDGTLAAIASQKAQEMFHLDRVSPDSVADEKYNLTRFWVLGNGTAPSTGNDKTTLLVNLRQDRPGEIHAMTGTFAEAGFSILLIYPNPMSGHPWEYTFLVELSGHVSDTKMQQALEELKGISLNSRPTVLGSYPDATSRFP